MSGNQDADKTQHQRETQQIEFDDSGSKRRRERGGARPVLLALAGLALGLLICGIGFGFGYAAGRVHGDALRYGGASWQFSSHPWNAPASLPADSIPVPGQGFGYVCEGWPEPDVEGARAWLGVGTEEGRGGPSIDYLIPGGPADVAGLEEGDIILEMDGERTRDYDDLVAVLADHDPCEDVTLVIERDRDEREIDMTLGGLVPFE
jgi:membrane-associated protease RseP (regulator of RpoE activity)